MQLKEKIGSDELVRYIEGLHSNLHAGYNPYADRINIYWKGEHITAFQRGYLSRYNEYTYTGSVKNRGYQYVLEVLFKCGYLNYEARKDLYKKIEELNVYTNPVDFIHYKTQEQIDDEKQKEMLEREYGITFHDGVLKEDA